jgi:hypothetical protein
VAAKLAVKVVASVPAGGEMETPETPGGVLIAAREELTGNPGD